MPLATDLAAATPAELTRSSTPWPTRCATAGPRPTPSWSSTCPTRSPAAATSCSWAASSRSTPRSTAAASRIASWTWPPTTPPCEAIERGEPVSDEQLLDLERSLRQELGGAGLELTEANIRNAYGELQVGSLLEFLRYLLDLDGIPDYAEIVRRQFDGYIAGHAFSADQIRFLRAVQSVFLQKRRLHAAPTSTSRP